VVKALIAYIYIGMVVGFTTNPTTIRSWPRRINRNNNKDEKLVQLLYKLEDKDVFSELDFVITQKK
jgi:transaldolase